MLTMERLFTRVIRLIHTPIRVYDSAGHLTCVFIDQGEQQDPLACDEAFLNQLLDLGSEDGPRLHLGADEIIFGVIRHEASVYILGPCCLGRDAIAAARALVRRHKMDAKAPYRVTRVTLDFFCETLLLLYEYLTGRTLSVNELYLQCFGGKELERRMQGKMQEVLYGLRETHTVHNPYSQELREQESIRNGDLESLYLAFQESYVGKIGTLAKEPLRQAKNLSIAVLAVAARSAIQGGMLPEVAFSMSDAFVQHMEELTSVGEVLAAARQAEIEYCTAVASLSESRIRNPLILRCKELVEERLHTRLTVKELAKEMSITPEYLSQLFLKETGVKLTEYILTEKIRASKNQLVYTNNSYEAIAHSLGFSTQSHFGQVFKKYTGLTPRQYREGRTDE